MQRYFEIQKAIFEIENPYPKDDLITCYKDFLKVRDFLPYYKYNINVLMALLDLTSELWYTQKRINRISLLESIKWYGYSTLHRVGNPVIIAESSKMPVEFNIKMFSLFKNCFEGKNSLSPNQLEVAKKICNSILINAILEDTDVNWLCKNVATSNMILNRILRFPCKSEIISIWAKENYFQDEYRIRRAEIVGWILDEDPDFEIEKQTLIDDFEYFNMIDAKAIIDYENEFNATQIIERDLKGILPPHKRPNYDSNLPIYTSNSIVSIPSLKLTRRPFSVQIDLSKNPLGGVPDFEKMSEIFYQNIEITLKVSMLWSIAYSRLPDNKKSELLKKYYSDEVYWTFYKICRKLKLLGPLKWLMVKYKY